MKEWMFIKIVPKLNKKYRFLLKKKDSSLLSLSQSKTVSDLKRK